MYEYRAIVLRVVDGDTVDVDIDLGFGIWMKRERVRMMGIDTPESRTRDKVEKVFGLAAKERLIQLCSGKFRIKSLGKGKYGRILGIPYTEDGKDVCQKLIKEGHAVEYWGGTKKAKVREDGTWGE